MLSILCSAFHGVDQFHHKLMGGHGDIVAVPGLHDRAVDDVHLGAAARLQVGVDAGEAVRRLLQVQPDAGDLLLGVERVTVGGGGGAQHG